MTTNSWYNEILNFLIQGDNKKAILSSNQQKSEWNTHFLFYMHIDLIAQKQQEQIEK